MAEISIDREQLVARLVDLVPKSRLARIGRQPVRIAQIAALRHFGGTRIIEAPLLWGDRFRGILPEAVTALIWRFGAYEATTTMFLTRYLEAGATFVDVGAHFGYFSLLASRLVGPQGCVISIEAMPTTFCYLEANVALNRLSNVRTFNFAASDTEQTLIFRDHGVVYSSLNGITAPKGALSQSKSLGISVDVQAHRLDAISLVADDRHVAVIKIDAESSEELVLSGLAATIARQLPVVIVELGGGDADEDERAARIAALMATTGHLPFTYDGKLFHEIRHFSGLPYVNCFFLAPLQRSRMKFGVPFDGLSQQV